MLAREGVAALETESSPIGLLGVQTCVDGGVIEAIALGLAGICGRLCGFVVLSGLFGLRVGVS